MEEAVEAVVEAPADTPEPVVETPEVLPQEEAELVITQHVDDSQAPEAMPQEADEPVSEIIDLLRDRR